MISTWGIFWIGFFGVWVIGSLLEAIVDLYAIRRLSKVATPETIKEILNRLQKG